MTKIVFDTLNEILEKSSYILSQYDKDLISKFINLGEYGLAFEGLAYPYYTKGHSVTPEIENLFKNLAERMELKFPPEPVTE